MASLLETAAAISAFKPALEYKLPLDVNIHHELFHPLSFECRPAKTTNSLNVYVQWRLYLNQLPKR